MKHLLLGVLLLTFAEILICPASGGEKPNILLVLSDDHSLPHVGVYGCTNCEEFSLTPKLDRFAEEGIRFNRAYTAAPQCAPSRTSMFAGRSPIGLRATRFAQPASAETPFFTDLLRDAGYWTGLDGRHQHLDGKKMDADHISEMLVQENMRGKTFESRFDHFVQGIRTKAEAIQDIPGIFSGILDQVPEAQPFFLYFGFSQPHRKWGDDHEGIDPAKLQLPPDWPDLPEVRLDYARYLAEVRDLDTGFGHLMQVLEDRGLSQNTLVIFMGDNGEALLRGKGTLYQRGINVPLLIRWPEKIEAGVVSESLISGVDLAPTILDAAELSPAPGMTGMSFLTLMLGQPMDERTEVYAERGWHWGPITRSDGFDLSRSITTERFHFIYNALPDRSYTPVDMASKNIAWTAIKDAEASVSLPEPHHHLYFRNPRPLFELYDLKKDPFQLNNLSGKARLETTEIELREKLDRWMIREGDYLPLPSHARVVLRK
ncbi:MAG: sulfatase [Verrucomicrobiota bacterium]|nr:sulfatase [Verrucomicrobiota bacterium]